MIETREGAAVFASQKGAAFRSNTQTTTRILRRRRDTS